MKAAKWREFSPDELQQKARELTEEIFNLRFQLSMGVAKNPSRLEPGEEGSGAGQYQCSARRRAPPWVSERVVKAWSCRTRCRRRAWCGSSGCFRHPRYQRVVRASKKLKAHDETNESRVGDRVLIEETRPLSKEEALADPQGPQPRVLAMIQPRSMLDVADNSGAKKVQCIRVMGWRQQALRLARDTVHRGHSRRPRRTGP